MSEHYFTERPGTAPARRQVRLALRDLQLTLATDAGVFSPDAVDVGTLVLLTGAPPPPATGHLLDLGCGYGPLTLALACRSPGATVWGVDVNARARDLARENAAAAGLGNVRIGGPDEVPGAIRFAAIWSNPPIKVGKPVLHELLLRWLPRLTPDGLAHLVVHKHLGSDSLQRWLVDQGFGATRVLSQRGYRVLAVSPPVAPSATPPVPGGPP
ncbi:MAG TPA: methyltransferase [Cryptosporangiaceae bacterium]|nr:methyltransferase [Cryptosporangiaceae bacterium]